MEGVSAVSMDIEPLDAPVVGSQSVSQGEVGMV